MLDLRAVSLFLSFKREPVVLCATMREKLTDMLDGAISNISGSIFGLPGGMRKPSLARLAMNNSSTLAARHDIAALMARRWASAIRYASQADDTPRSRSDSGHSLNLDVAVADHLAPLLAFLLEIGGEFRRRVANRNEAYDPQLLFDVGHRDNL